MISVFACSRLSVLQPKCTELVLPHTRVSHIAQRFSGRRISFCRKATRVRIGSEECTRQGISSPESEEHGRGHSADDTPLFLQFFADTLVECSPEESFISQDLTSVSMASGDDDDHDHETEELVAEGWSSLMMIQGENYSAESADGPSSGFKKQVGSTERRGLISGRRVFTAVRENWHSYLRDGDDDYGKPSSREQVLGDLQSKLKQEDDDNMILFGEGEVLEDLGFDPQVDKLKSEEPSERHDYEPVVVGPLTTGTLEEHSNILVESSVKAHVLEQSLEADGRIMTEQYRRDRESSRGGCFEKQSLSRGDDECSASVNIFQGCDDGRLESQGSASTVGEADEMLEMVEEKTRDLLREFLQSRTGSWDPPAEGRVYRWRKQGSSSQEASQTLGLQPRGAAICKDESLFSAWRRWRDKDQDLRVYIPPPDKKIIPGQQRLVDSGYGISDLPTQEPKLLGPVSEILRIANNLPKNHSLEDHLDEFTNKLSIVEGNLVLEALGEERLFMQVLSFFQWMRLHEPCLLDSRSFSIIFILLGKAAMMDEALTLYDNMPPGESFRCVHVYNALMTALLNCGRNIEIFCLLEEMQRWGTEPDSVTFCILITSMRKGKHTLKDVWAIYEDMITRGVIPEVAVFGSLIKAFCDAGHRDEALLVTEEMERLGIRLNIVIYNTLIDAYGKADQMEEAEGLLVEMKEKELHPNETTYNSLVHGYGLAGQCEVAEALLREMEAVGLKPDVVTYTALICAYGKRRLSEKAANVFYQMRKIGIAPNAYSYTALIHAYSEGGWHEKAALAFESMQREGHSPSVETYTALLDAYRRVGDIKMVKEVWKAMRSDGCMGTRVTFLTLMDAFAKQGQFRDARDTIFEFGKLGYQPDVMVYNMLLNAYARGGQHDRAPDIMKEMRAAGFNPDAFSYCTLIYSFLRVRDFTKAFKYHDEMCTKRKKPDPKTYAKLRAILKACLQKKRENNKRAELGQRLKQEGQNTEKVKSFWKHKRRHSRRLIS